MCFFGRDGKGAENHQRWGLRNEAWTGTGEQWGTSWVNNGLLIVI